MNRTNMNFGARQDLGEDEELVLEEDPETNGSSTTTNKNKKHKVRRFESSKFTEDMFDPDHGPSEISERMEESEPSQ
jgi:hypothetical protein